MTDTLLRSLRQNLLDESEPLAGLLRKCLLLGAETGSEALREWARRELNGYGDKDETPQYRKIASPAILIDTISGYMWAKNQIISRYQIPHNAREYVPEEISLKQPIEELEQLAGQTSLKFSSHGFAYAQSVWNNELPEFQQIMTMSFVSSGSVVKGVLGQIRTKLVDVVADLTADTPLSELPKKGQVDDAVSHRIGDIYNTTIQAPSGPVAIGRRGKASTEGLTVEDALQLLEKVQRTATDVASDQPSELLGAIDDLRTAVESDRPETGDVVKKAGRLRAIASTLGVAAVTAATNDAVKAIVDLAINGAFS